MTNITELKEKCSVIEQCLPVSYFREQVAKTHGEMFECIIELEAERDQSRNQAARECVEITDKLIHVDCGDQWSITRTGALMSFANAIKEHFGITDRFAGAGKVMEGNNSVRNETA